MAIGMLSGPWVPGLLLTLLLLLVLLTLLVFLSALFIGAALVGGLLLLGGAALLVGLSLLFGLPLLLRLLTLFVFAPVLVGVSTLILDPAEPLLFVGGALGAVIALILIGMLCFRPMVVVGRNRNWSMMLDVRVRGRLPRVGPFPTGRQESNAVVVNVVAVDRVAIPAVAIGVATNENIATDDDSWIGRRRWWRTYGELGQHGLTLLEHDGDRIALLPAGIHCAGQLRCLGLESADVVVGAIQIRTERGGPGTGSGQGIACCVDDICLLVCRRLIGGCTCLCGVEVICQSVVRQPSRIEISGRRGEIRPVGQVLFEIGAKALHLGLRHGHVSARRSHLHVAVQCPADHRVQSI
jgi:hypothetical protein